MSNSGRKINYTLRPAKSVERKMLKDIFSRLNNFSNISDYVYLGFGAKYFTDMSYFHRNLHFKRLISIEYDENNKERYRFNSPYRCVDLKFGHSSIVLPTLKELKTDRSIVWLDYDSTIQPFMKEDISTVVTQIKSGSIFAISYNSKPPILSDLKSQLGDQSGGYYRAHIRKLFGDKGAVSDSLEDDGMGKWTKYSQVLRAAMYSYVEKYVKDRNPSLEEDGKFIVKQLGYFDYQDGTEMSTLVFLVYTNSDQVIVDKCDFEKLSFVRGGDQQYKIQVPNLTFKEIQQLTELMPINSEEMEAEELWDKKIYTIKDVKQFAEIYKYHPTYFEFEGG